MDHGEHVAQDLIASSARSPIVQLIAGSPIVAEVEK
jgi:hypothetical protein